MDAGIVGVFVPIVMFVVIGLVIITLLYLRSKEKQMLIEKGLSLTEMKEFYTNKSRSRDPYLLMKLGVIAVFLGIGLGIGLMLQENTTHDFWVPFIFFVSMGLGFVIAGFIGKDMSKKEEVI
jgi:general stress protein CsbA